MLDRNGLVGILFYWSLVGLGAGVLNAQLPISAGVLVTVAVVTAIVIWLSERLKPLVEGHGFERADLGMGLVEGFFELFETVLSLMSNTLSYVRMGAFAVAHGALSLVVFILADMVDPGEADWLLDRGCTGKPGRDRFRGNDCWHPDASSGALEVL